MRSKIAIVLLAGAFLAGCESNHKDTKATAAAGHEDSKVCDMPGQGAAVAKAEPAKQPMAVYGGEQKMADQKAVPISTVLANPAAYKDKYVRLTGTVTSVCAKKGCWLRVAPDKTTASAGAAAAPTTQPMKDIFIKFQDPPAGRLIPMEASGKTAVVEGTLKVGRMPEAAARHFAEDGGASEAEISKIVGPQPQLVLTGPVVAIEGIEKPTEQ